MNEVIDSSVWERCPECYRDTRYTVCNHFTTTVSPEEAPPEACNGERLLFVWTTLQIIECRGCRSPRFRQGWTPTPHMSGSWVWRVHAGSLREREPSIAGNCLPADVAKLHRESRLAFDCGAFTLATIGMRGTIEAVCNDRRCRGDSLKKRIGKLNGILSASEIHLLQAHRALGNSAAHQMQTPTATELAAALDVLEHLLKTLYELPRRAEDLNRFRAERLGGQSVCLPPAC